MRNLILLALCMPSLALSQAQDTDKSKTKGAVALFWEACVHQYPNREQFVQWIAAASFQELAADAAAGLVKEPGGRAWAIDNAGVRYLLVAENSNLCTVYMKTFDPNVFIESFANGHRSLAANRWIEFDSSERAANSSGDAKFTVYKYMNKGSSALNIIVSEIPTGKSFYELGMTATMARTANKPLQPTSPKDGAAVER